MKLTINESLLRQVISQYGFEIERSTIKPIGNGHINETLLVVDASHTIVLQRINDFVFPNPKAVVNNCVKIGQHLSCKVKENQYDMLPLLSIKTNSGEDYVETNQGIFRALVYINDSISLDAVATQEQAYNVAHAYASFAAALGDFDALSLEVIIDNFHDLACRYQQLETACSEDSHGRLSTCRTLVAYIMEQYPLVNEVCAIQAKVPQRVTHNDTKINNLLIDNKQGKPKAVVDLDTCMPGYLMHDFGDMVRTCCSNLAEDDDNIELMQFNSAVFTQLVKGYIDAWQDRLDENEIASLWLGAKMMPLIIGIRFLTDYLNGDTYFGCCYEQHNLARATNQINLYKLIIANETRLKTQIYQYCATENV